MKMVAELWRNGISADLQYDDDRTLEDLAAECEEQSTPSVTFFYILPRPKLRSRCSGSWSCPALVVAKSRSAPSYADPKKKVSRCS